jgi:hypothetical protein
LSEVAKGASPSPEREEEFAVFDELEKWNWGACLLGPVWGFAHGIVRSLLTLIPVYGLYEMYLLGRNGNHWAWERRRWDSLAHFHKTQRNWALGALVVYALLLLVILVVASS